MTSWHYLTVLIDCLVMLAIDARLWCIYTNFIDSSTELIAA